MFHARPLFLTLAQLTATSACPEASGIHGVLSDRPVESLCTIFEADEATSA